VTRVLLDLGLCNGYGNCVMSAPDVFDIDDASGLAVVLVPDPPPDRRAAVEEAVRLCPVQALRVDT
jgi:ferredoxin